MHYAELVLLYVYRYLWLAALSADSVEVDFDSHTIGYIVLLPTADSVFMPWKSRHNLRFNAQHDTARFAYFDLKI